MTRETKNHSLRFPRSRVLVTGGAGFIGSHLCASLHELGCEVVCLDNLSSGKRENLNGLIGRERFKIIEGSIESFPTCQKATEKVDFIFHHAALVSVVECMKDPARTDRINRKGFQNILEAARWSRVKRVVYASSSAVYGDSTKKIQEETDPLKPLSPYGLSKMHNEQDAHAYFERYDLETVGLRYFNVYGPRQNPQGTYAAVIPKFIECVLTEKAPTIFGNGEQTRDFIFVEEVVRANLLAALTESGAMLGQVCNVATGKSVSVATLLKQIRENTARLYPQLKQLPTLFEKARTGEILASVGSPARAEAWLGFHSTLSLAEGLDLLLAERASWSERKSS